LRHRIRYIHWNAAEADEYIEKLRNQGFDVEYDERPNSHHFAEWRTTPPDLFLIDLTRLPSHGREAGVALRNYKALRTVPIVFLDGEPEKAEQVKQILPDAIYVQAAKLVPTLKRVLRTGPVKQAAKPVAMMERYGNRSIAQKVGIEPHSAVALWESPGQIEQMLEGLPDGVHWVEPDDERATLAILFARDEESVDEAFLLALRHPHLKKIWVARRKAGTGPKKLGAVSENLVRETGLARGFVDYKVCALSNEWSGLLFARKKPEPNRGLTLISKPAPKSKPSGR
jgi:CheY-like chemotaxis protein